MNPDEFKRRTKAFALRVVRLVSGLPKDPAARILGQQLLRAGTSVGANYRAACRARSKAEFIAKLGIVEEETDESIYWIELLAEAGFVKQAEASSLSGEAGEILSMVVSSIRTARTAQPVPRPSIRNLQ